MNVLAKIDVGKFPDMATNESIARRKRGSPMGTKDSTPGKRRSIETSCSIDNPDEGEASKISNENVQL